MPVQIVDCNSTGCAAKAFAVPAAPLYLGACCTPGLSGRQGRLAGRQRVVSLAWRTSLLRVRLCWLSLRLLQEACKGVRKPIDLSRLVGTQMPPVEVDIPPGLNTGQTIQVSKESMACTESCTNSAHHSLLLVLPWLVYASVGACIKA
jgi:hypothetical protein